MRAARLGLSGIAPLLAGISAPIVALAVALAVAPIVAPIVAMTMAMTVTMHVAMTVVTSVMAGALALAAAWLAWQLRAARRGMRQQRAACARLQDMLAHAGRVATLGEMAAAIAHEIRQPLAAISLETDASLRWLARDAVDLKEVSESLERVRGEAERAERVVRGLRALSRREGRRIASLSLRSAWEEMLPLVPAALLARAAHIEVDVPAALPEVLGDRVQIQQVMLNLLTNALQALPGTADRPGLVHVGGRTADGAVWFELRDNGAGIDPQHLPRVFDPFFTTRADGMGMGLAICRGIIEAHGGTMTARSTLGWTTVAFALPPVAAAGQTPALA
ncbi:hypothetical protein DFLDMN_004444 [Cupriavidus sp. H19C3]